MTGNTDTSASGALDADDLQSLGLDGLRRRWRNLSGKTAAPSLTRALLQRLIAYEQQVVRFRGLAPDTERMLARIAAEAKGAGEESDSARVARATGSDRRVAPGTILVREWQGTLQRVTVMTDGFAWNGTTYPSLSRVAREITGVSWNGHVFFGGKAKQAGKERSRGSGGTARPAGSNSPGLANSAAALPGRRIPVAKTARDHTASASS